jgi:microcystin degradation protein MlrC
MSSDKIRIVSGGIEHESNTFITQFIPGTTWWGHGNLRGKALIDFHRHKRTNISGFIHVCEREGVDLITILYGAPDSKGRVLNNSYLPLLSELLEGIEKALPVDGVLLHLHGGGATEDEDDLEGHVLEQVRKIVGPNIPVVTPFDMHANIGPKTMKYGSFFCGYDTYPHIDGYERSAEVTQLLIDTIRGKIHPTIAYAQPNMIITPVMQKTGYHPMKTVIEKIHQIEAEPGVLSATVSAGYPYADVPYPGVTMMVVTDGDQALAQRKADELSQFCWDLRHDFLARVVPMDRALDMALAEPEGPVVLTDQADNPGGGPPQDGTIALKAMLDRGVTNACVVVMRDPEAVAKAIETGVGNSVTMKIGGKTDPWSGEPLQVTGTVRRISDGKYVPKGPMGGGVVSDMGRTAVLNVNGIDVILTEKSQQATDLELYRSLGLDPTDYRILLVKSCVHYRAAHEPIAKKIIELDLPGWHGTRLAAFPWKKLRRPVWPLDVESLGISELMKK